MKLRTLLIAGGAVALIAAIAAAAWLGLRPAAAETAGSCDAAYYELTTEQDDGALEVDFDLLSSAPGERWQVTVEHNGEVLLETERMTDEEAELDLDLEPRATGDDAFTVTATPEDGDACVARITHG